MTELLVIPSELERAAGRLQASADQVRSVVGTLLPAVTGGGSGWWLIGQWPLAPQCLRMVAAGAGFIGGGGWRNGRWSGIRRPRPGGDRRRR